MRSGLPHPRQLLLLMMALIALASDARTVPQASAGDPGRRDATVQFVVGNVEYLLVHELAHFLITEKDIPVIGPAEYAADYVATLALIREEPLDDAQANRAQGFLLATAEGFIEAWRAGSASGIEAPYHGAHALSIQRYYQIVCLLYGSDPDGFAALAKAAGLPPERARGCIDEYRSASRAMDWLLATYGRKPGDGDGAPVTIVYGEPPTMTSKSLQQAIIQIQLFERVAARLRQRFTLEQPFTIVMRACKQPQAGWLPQQRELVVCYELLDALYVLGLQAQAAESTRGSDRQRR
jgi:hypothetical protein